MAYTPEETKVWITDPNDDGTDQENAGREMNAEKQKQQLRRRMKGTEELEQRQHLYIFT